MTPRGDVVTVCLSDGKATATQLGNDATRWTPFAAGTAATQLGVIGGSGAAVAAILSSEQGASSQ